jgi:hypothetical protein
MTFILLIIKKQQLTITASPQDKAEMTFISLKSSGYRVADDRSK